MCCAISHHLKSSQMKLEWVASALDHITLSPQHVATSHRDSITYTYCTYGLVIWNEDDDMELNRIESTQKNEMMKPFILLKRPIKRAITSIPWSRFGDFQEASNFFFFHFVVFLYYSPLVVCASTVVGFLCRYTIRPYPLQSEFRTIKIVVANIDNNGFSGDTIHGRCC